jgi:hypothetical protein
MDINRPCQNLYFLNKTIKAMLISVKSCFLNCLCLICFKNINAQSCERYIPCQNRTITYTAMIIKEGKLNIEDERVQYSVTGQNAVQFDRTLTVNIIGGGSYTSNTKGVVQVSVNQISFPPAYYLPTPITLLSFFDPPQVELTGEPCIMPNTLNAGPMAPCNNMRIRASRSKVSNAPAPGQVGRLNASQALDYSVSYSSRVVLATNQMLTISGNTFECVIVKERYAYNGNFSGAHWEINWYARGIGLVQSKYFENDPGSNFGANGDLGSKFIKSW